MAKKRKAASRSASSGGPRELDPADARLGPITTFEDVANSEDEFFMDQDKIMMDDEPRSKRLRRDEEDMELSDEEVLGYEDSDEEDDRPAQSKASAAKAQLSDDEDEAETKGDEANDPSWWGSSRREYYDADNIETEADALEEEAEAKRLQQKKLSKMAEEDFAFDGDEWLAAGADEDEDQEVVTEVLKEAEVTDAMGPEERRKMLQSRYPELDHLVTEFGTLRPQLVELKTAAQDRPSQSLDSVKYWVLGCYISALASYFAILTSPARDSPETCKTLDASDLRDHEIMETLVRCRDAWKRIRDVKSLGSTSTPEVPLPLSDSGSRLDAAGLTVHPTKSKKKARKDKSTEDKLARKLAKAKASEAAIADLYDLPLGRKAPAKQQNNQSTQDDDNSDFGEEDALDSRTAADKAARKKSLKFYTSQIAQRANRRAGAGRDAGGDTDIPYRERLRDRQARLMAEAERRGKKDSKHGADLGDDSDEDDMQVAGAIRNEENDYYNSVAQSSKEKRDDKAARYAAYAAATKADRVVEKEEIGEDGKRKVSYAIEKNKGLTPRRKKENRNPRVKKRKQYEAKQKKLKSMKPVWTGGEPKGGYQGELSGINAGVIKSVKL